MRVMMLSTPYATHFTPMLPTAWALRAAGHEVVVAGQPDIVGSAHAAGLNTATLGDPFLGSEIMRSKLPDGVRVNQLIGRPDIEHGSPSPFWGTHARYLLPRYLEFARAWKPDLILSEQMEFAGLVVAGVLGIPAVKHRWGVDPLMAAAHAECARHLHGICVRLGLTGLPDPALVLDPAPPVLQLPGVTPGHPVRFVPFNGTGTTPDWVRERTGTHRVCVCLGNFTLALNGVPLLRHLIEACGALAGVEVIVPADIRYHEALGPAPDNVRIVGPTPFTAFFDTCDAVVHHGGANSAMTAAAFGPVSYTLRPAAAGAAAARGPVRVRRPAHRGGRGADGRRRGRPGRSRPGPRRDHHAPGRGPVREGRRRAARDDCIRDRRETMAAMPGPGRAVPVLEALAGA